MLYKDHLESPRIITRFVTPEDAHVWEEYCSDPVATKYTAIPGKSPREMAQFVMDVTLIRYKANRLGLQALILKETGEFVGKCGLLIQDLNGVQEVEIGYHLIRKYWGNGYASEAAQLFRNYAFTEGLADSIVSIVHPQNELSKKVALRNGMQLVDTAAEFKGDRYHLFRITREEWVKLKISG